MVFVLQKVIHLYVRVTLVIEAYYVINSLILVPQSPVVKGCVHLPETGHLRATARMVIFSLIAKRE